MTLAKELGMSLRRAQREIDSREFSLWMARREMEPSEQDRENMRAAAAIVMEAAGRGVKLEMDEVLRMIDPWPDPLDAPDTTPAPPPGTLRARVELFNAGIRGLAQRKEK